MRPMLLLVMMMPCLWTCSALAETNWPQFRGPGGQGMSDAADVPLTWGEKHNVKWKTDIHGKAWSSPVIWKDQIWLTTATPDGKELSVLCVDKATGKILIDKVIFHVENPQYCIDFNSYASPTPCIEEGKVYVTFGAPGTACLDTATGAVLWARTDFVCNHFRGAGSSPLLWKNLLIMNFDGSDFQFIVALDKATGKNVWRTPRSIDFQDLNADGQVRAKGDFRKAFSTPRVTEMGGKPILISQGSNATYCYEPETGKELWRTEFRAGHSSSITPVFGDGLIFVTTGNQGQELWAISPGGHGVVNDTNVVWKYKKKITTRPSPLLVDGLLYMINEGGIISCLEPKTGGEVWHARLDGNFSASPLYAAGRIYLSSQTGKTTVIAPGRELKVLAENDLDAGIMATLAVSDRALYVRTINSLYRIEESK